MTDATKRATGPTTAPVVGPTDTISIDEIVERYRGEWILMRVTKDDEDGWPERGYLLERAASQNEIIAAMERWVHLADDGNRWPFYTFLAEPLVKSGPEYAAAVAEFFAGLIRAAGEHGARAGR
jgi:hypothetical protein